MWIFEAIAVKSKGWQVRAGQRAWLRDTSLAGIGMVWDTPAVLGLTPGLRVQVPGKQKERKKEK